MKPISGLIELSDDFLRDRQNEMQRGIVGLGPPDLVCLYKFQTKSMEIPSYHYVCGYPFGSESAIVDYFMSLLKSRPKKFLGKVRYEIQEAQFCCWNSFSNSDIRIDLKNKVISSVSIKTADDRDIVEMDSIMWKELKLSTMLRFWMAPTPIFRAIYNYPFKNYPALRLLVPPLFSDEDIKYIVEKHSTSDELEAALACFIVSVGGYNERMKTLLDIIIPRIPRVFCHFISFFPRVSPLAKEFALIANIAYQKMADDIQLAYTAVHYAIEMNDITICESAIPILMNGLWSSPIACCGMAQIAIYRGSATDALYFANSACYAKKYQKGNTEVLNYLSPKLESKKAPRVRPKMIEGELVTAHLSGHYYLIYHTVVCITSIASSIKVRTMLKSKFGSPKDSPSYLRDSEEGDPTFPDELFDLFDPGVAITAPEVPYYVKRLPMSVEFSTISTAALNDIQIRDTVMRTKRIECSQDARNAAIIAMKLCDKDLYEVSLAALKKMKKLRVISELMKIRLNPAKYWVPLPKSTDVPPNKMTMNENNALLIIQQISKGITSTLS